jgi:phosphomethylpyrimidine synthase
VSTGPIRGSSKRAEQVPGFPEMTIRVRRVDLSNGEHLDLYDTSGPYTDANAVIDLEAGLPRSRERWARPEPVDGASTQLDHFHHL